MGNPGLVSTDPFAYPETGRHLQKDRILMDGWDGFTPTKIQLRLKTQTLNVGYIYLDLGSFGGKCR